MRQIAYLTPLYFDEESYLGGGERYPLNLAKGVVKSGEFEVTLISYGDAARSLSLAPGVRLSVLPSARRRPGSERLAWEILDVIREADLVHIHQAFTRSGEVGLLVSKLLGRPVCITDHGGAASALGRSLGMLELADRVTCYSRFGAQLLDDLQATVELVPGGVDDEFFSPSEAETAREGVLFVGRLLPHKGVDRLIAAMPPGVPLTVCGQPYDKRYFEHLRALSTGKPVEFVLDADDATLLDLYRRAVAVVLPSVYVDYFGGSHAWPELMGFSLLEGMACETPAICSRVGGMPEYIDHGQTGYVFDELAELTGLIEQLVAEPALCRELGRQGREKVASSYGLAAAGTAMSSVYGELIAETR